MAENIAWTTEVEPRERYRIQYQGRDGEVTVREVELCRIGTFNGRSYAGVLDGGHFKTLRTEGIRTAEKLGEGPSRLQAFPTYETLLPVWAEPNSVLRVPTLKGNRTWMVDLNAYVCACPEKRIRSARGYAPGQLGMVCPHLARAILANLAPYAPGWTPELRAVLADPTFTHIDNLT